MKKFINSISGLALLAAALFATACDKTSVDEVVASAPVIHSFSPASAPVGEEIVITGEFLNAVTSASIGGVEVPIVERVSNTRISILAAAEAHGGRIALTNTVGTGESADEFAYSYVAPQITAAILQSSVDMGDQMLIAGKYMGAVEAVVFTAEGYTEGNEATIVDRTTDELVVKCPYVEADRARITLRYFDGTSHVETALDDAPQIAVQRYSPTFDAVTFERTAVGRSVTVTGNYLTKVDEILVNGFPASISKEMNKLTFTVPAGDFADGETVTSVVASYFDGHESTTLSDAFVVYVPFVKFWENVTVPCQGRWEGSSFASFFSPETGIIYENAVWKTKLDPISLQYGAQMWSGTNNIPKSGVLSDEEYDSVVPYFFFSAVSGNVLQVNSPANSNSQLKNFFINAINPSGTKADDNRVPGLSANIPGTPILGFRYLNPNASNPTEKEVVRKVLAGEIDNINEELFPLNTADNTCAGIGLTSLVGAIKSSSWCDHQTQTLENLSGYSVDAVFLVLYYANCGYSKEAPASNVKRVGLLHVKSIDWAIYQASTPNYGCSVVNFDIYWQKYDYDYSKVN